MMKRQGAVTPPSLFNARRADGLPWLREAWVALASWSALCSAIALGVSCRSPEAPPAASPSAAASASASAEPLLPSLNSLATAALFAADATSPAERPLDLEGLIGGWAKNVFQHEPGLLAWVPDRPSGEGGYEVRVAVYYALLEEDTPRPSAEKGLAYAAAEVYASRRIEAGIKEELQGAGRAEAPLDHKSEEGKALYEQLVRQAVRQARRSVERKLELRYAEVDRFAELLASGDKDATADVLSAIAERKLDAAVPLVTPLLEHGDRAIVKAAITALGAIDTETSVKPLAALTSRNDEPLVELVVAALARMNNPLARRYLSGIAETHMFESVRSAAARALEEEKAAP